MNRRLLLPLAALAAAVIATPALADPIDERTSRAAMQWEYTYLGLSAVDTIQTIHAIRSGKAVEANPLMGKRPSTAKIVAVKLAGSALQFALFNEVRKRDPKMALRVAQVSVALQGTVVALNMRFTF